jgi:hypothetical protein
MRALVALSVFAVACSGSSSNEHDATPLDDAVCKANLEAELDRSCSTPADCIVVESADCCGPVMLAIHAGTESRFQTSESRYETCLACPPLGCNHAPQDEAGHTAGAGQAIVADCIGSQCVAAVR